jgi:lysophospholipase L1-like esterase
VSSTTASLTATPTTIDAGTSESLWVRNTGTSRVTVVSGGQTTYIRAGRNVVVHVNGATTAAVLASDGGSGSIVYEAQGSRAVSGVVGSSGAVLTTAAQVATDVAQSMAADPAFTGTFAALRTARPGLFTGLMATLSAGVGSCGLQVVGDSTGATTARWPYLLGQSLASLYPAYSVLWMPWDNESASYNVAPTTIQAGPLGDRYIQVTDTAITHPGDGTTVAGDLEVMVDVQPDGAWNPAGGVQTLACRFDNAPDRMFRLQLKTSGGYGILGFDTSVDGTNIIGPVNSDTTNLQTVFGTNVRGKIRVTYVAATGAVEFYYSTSVQWGFTGVTWTKIGATKTLGTTGALHMPTGGAGYALGARTGTAEPFVGKFYGVRVNNGIGGQSVVSHLIDHWQTPNTQTGTSQWGGSPILMIVNGSYSGASIVEMAANLTAMTPLHGQSAVILSDGHNDTYSRNAAYVARVQAAITAIRTRFPGAALGIIGQNPRIPPATFINQHAIRRALLANLASMNGAQFVDIYRAFSADPRGLAVLTNADGIHPSDADGSPLWRDVMFATAVALG